MINVFFKDIPSIVFEPIAVLGWLGLITAFFIYRKKCSALFLTVIFALAFMILWRCAIQIVSSRYAEIMIFPMTVAAAFFIFQTGNIRKVFPKFPEKYVRFIPLALVSVLTVICIAKILNYNTCSPVIEAAYTVKADQTPGKRILYTLDSDRRNQIEYYTGEPVVFIKDLPEDQGAACRQIIAKAVAEDFQTVYIFAISRTETPPITAEEAGATDSSWQLIAENYLNSKKKKALRVYRYSTPAIQ